MWSVELVNHISDLSKAIVPLYVFCVRRGAELPSKEVQKGDKYLPHLGRQLDELINSHPQLAGRMVYDFFLLWNNETHS